jgi:hypothetical protein
VSQQINLFNPAFERRTEYVTSAAMAQALGLLLVGAVALGWYGQRSVDALQQQVDRGAHELAQKQQRLAKASAEFAPRRADAELGVQLARAEAELAGMRGVADVLERGELGNTKGYSDYFRALARQNPSGLWLTGVAIGGAGTDISVQGRALEPALVPVFLGRLTREPALQGKAFASLKIGQPARDANAPKDGLPKDGASAAPYVEFSVQSGAAGADR